MDFCTKIKNNNNYYYSYYYRLLGWVFFSQVKGRHQNLQQNLVQIKLKHSGIISFFSINEITKLFFVFQTKAFALPRPLFPQNLSK